MKEGEGIILEEEELLQLPDSKIIKVLKWCWGVIGSGALIYLFGCICVFFYTLAIIDNIKEK